MRAVFLLLGVLCFLSAAIAVEPEEMLADPILESRAQALDEKIRCVQCQSESIASSNADWAHDARLMVRSLITDGATDDEVLNFFVTRYDEKALMEPRRNGTNLLLWVSGPFILLLSLLGFFLYHRKSERSGLATLSADEEARLAQLLERIEEDER